MSAWCTEEENVKKRRQALFRLPGYKAIIALMNQNMPKLLRYLFPRFQDFVFISVLLLGVLLGPRFLGDGDPGRHIVIGQIILKEHYIPQTDIFSHTKAGLPLTTTEWLSEVLYAAANLVMGLNGVVLLAILVIALTCTLVFRETARRSGSYLAAFILVFWMVAATLFHWLARPHLFSWLMTAIWAVAAERLARGERVPLWLFPLSMLVWVNLHGGFIIGFLILVAYLIGWVLDRYLNEEDPSSWDVFKRLLQAGLFSLLVTVLNPSGLKLWDNVVGHVGDAGLTFLQIDWRSPDFHMPNTWPFLLLVALTIFAFAANKKKLAGGQALLCGGLAMLAFYSVRNIPFFVIACLPILGEALRESGILKPSGGCMATLQKDLRGFLWSGMATVIVAALLLFGKPLDTAKLGNTFNPAIFPVKAVDWLEQHPQSGNVFNEFTWGGYILYRLWPETKVFIDGQTDFYGAGLVREYLTVLNAREGWENILTKYSVEWVLIPRNSALADRLKSGVGWNTLYEDNIAIILRKNVR
jgi:hypothetical protein